MHVLLHNYISCRAVLVYSDNANSALESTHSYAYSMRQSLSLIPYSAFEVPATNPFKPTELAPKPGLIVSGRPGEATTRTHPEGRRTAPCFQSVITDDQPQSPKTSASHLYAVQSLHP